MLTIPEQMSAAVKANAEAQHTIFANLFDKLHERLEELTRLNMEVVKASLAESTAYPRELIGLKNSQDFFRSAQHIINAKFKARLITPTKRCASFPPQKTCAIGPWRRTSQKPVATDQAY